MKDPIERQDAIDVFGDVHPLDYNAQTYLDKIKALPSAQPEIIYCKECKWKEGAACVRFAEVWPFPNDFCSRAERREEGDENERHD